MTDNEIVKALELEATPMERNCTHAVYEEACGMWCTKKHMFAENCKECKEHQLGYYGGQAAAALDLINRQKAEIERWQDEYKRACAERDAHICTIKFVKAEAVKEFAKRLKEDISGHRLEMYMNGLKGTPRTHEITYECVEEYIDNLVKEMVSDLQ